MVAFRANVCAVERGTGSLLAVAPGPRPLATRAASLLVSSVPRGAGSSDLRGPTKTMPPFALAATSARTRVVTWAIAESDAPGAPVGGAASEGTAVAIAANPSTQRSFIAA